LLQGWVGRRREQEMVKYRGDDGIPAKPRRWFNLTGAPLFQY